ncbi:MAG: hypothetical protein QOH30_2270, partial [Baekduia sp.]|nr:hypothetical protein [Baekduia sp.]
MAARTTSWTYTTSGRKLYFATGGPA